MIDMIIVMIPAGLGRRVSSSVTDYSLLTILTASRHTQPGETPGVRRGIVKLNLI